MIGLRWASLIIGVLAFVAAAFSIGRDGVLVALFGSLGLVMTFMQAAIWVVMRRYGRD